MKDKNDKLTSTFFERYLPIFVIVLFFFIGYLYGHYSPTTEQYHSETKAFKSSSYTCDLYLEYSENEIQNITLLECVYNWEGD